MSYHGPITTKTTDQHIPAATTRVRNEPTSERFATSSHKAPTTLPGIGMSPVIAINVSADAAASPSRGAAYVGSDCWGVTIRPSFDARKEKYERDTRTGSVPGLAA